MNYTKTLGLYLHIPFCASKCRYCDFYSVGGEEARMEPYTAALCAHIREYAARCAGYTVDTLYLGGGTPSALGAKRLARILAEVKKGFQLASRCEITVECNPESMDKAVLRALRRAGVNRLSVGVQSADDGELSLLGRPHTFAQAREGVALARELGFTNLSLDLMYGLPGQTAAQFLQSVEAALALDPAHLSCYGLKLEPDTPMGRESPALPDDDTQADTYLALCERMREAGYEHYEVSNWCLPGRRSRHNSRYWDLSEYLGLGPGAHSYLGEQRFSFVRDLTRYCEGVTVGGSIVDELEEIPARERSGEYVMLALRTADGLREGTYLDRFGKDFSQFTERLAPLVRAGLVARSMDGWRLTEQGFLVSNQIIAEILSWEEDAPADGTAAYEKLVNE